MAYKHILAPTKGLFTAAPPTMLEDEMSPSMSGVYLKDGEVVSDYGHSAFPSPGVLKTNQLNGALVKLFSYTQLSGITHLLAFTTTDAYEYNSTTTTWDCITKGQTVEDCEDAWTASANVTATADSSVKLRGTNSSKLVVAAAFTTGVAAYEDFASMDLSAEIGLHFWIYSSIATAAGDLQILLDNTSACVSPLETLNVPALTANTWTPVYVAYATPGNLTAIISVGLKVAVDNGAQTVYLDDIRSVDAFTGDSDNLFSVTVMSDTLIVTNGVNQPQKYTGTPATGLQDLSTALASGSITTSEVVIAAKDHVVFMNNTENAADAPQRASWSNIGKIEDYVGGTAGYQDLVDDESWILSAGQLSDNKWAIYKEKSIVEMEWVGGQTPFRFTTMVKDQTIAGKDCFTIVDGVHYVIGPREVYKYTGGETVTHIDTKIKRGLFSLVDYSYIARSFVLWQDLDDEIQFWVPTSTQYPDVVYCLDRVLEVWYVKDRSMTSWAIYTSASSLTIGDLVGTIGDQNFAFGDALVRSNTPITIIGDGNGKIYKLDKLTLNNDGVAITNEFQTPDFTFPSGENSLERTTRTVQLYFEAKGQSITTEFSTDGGLSWSPTQITGANTTTLTSLYVLYQQDFDVVASKIRFRFLNSTVSSGFYLRFYGFKFIPRSTRK